MDRLAAQYATMDTDELVALHQSGTLPDAAYPLLESELGRRAVAVQPRPDAKVTPPELPFFSAHWLGLHSADSARVFVTFLVPALLALILYGAV